MNMDLPGGRKGDIFRKGDILSGRRKGDIKCHVGRVISFNLSNHRSVNLVETTE